MGLWAVRMQFCCQASVDFPDIRKNEVVIPSEHKF